MSVKNNDLPKSGGWGMGYLGKRSEGWSSGWSMVVSVGKGAVQGFMGKFIRFDWGKVWTSKARSPPQGLEFLRGP